MEYLDGGIRHYLGEKNKLNSVSFYVANLILPRQILVGLRIREEEKMLQKELGKEYKDYMNNVPARLLPYLL